MPQITASTARRSIMRRLRSSADFCACAVAVRDIKARAPRAVCMIISLGSRPGFSLDRRRRPRSVEGRAPRRIQPHGNVELLCRRRQPVGLLIRTGPLVLDVDVERAIAVELELVAVAERKA